MGVVDEAISTTETHLPACVREYMGRQVPQAVDQVQQYGNKQLGLQQVTVQHKCGRASAQLRQVPQVCIFQYHCSARSACRATAVDKLHTQCVELTTPTTCQDAVTPSLLAPTTPSQHIHASHAVLVRCAPGCPPIYTAAGQLLCTTHTLPPRAFEPPKRWAPPSTKLCGVVHRCEA